MRILSINEALRLYYLLEPYLPEDMSVDLLDFVGTIISNMKEVAPEAFIDALGVILDKTREEVLAEVQPEESGILLAEALVDNSLLSLRDFIRTLENG